MNLSDQLKRCAGGETIDLGGATIAATLIRGASFARPVTIANGAIAGLDVRASRGLVFNQIALPTPRGTKHKVGYASADVHFRDLVVTGEPGVAIPLQTGTGLELRGVTDWTIERADVSGVEFGIVAMETEGGRLSDSVIHHLRKDAVRIVDCNRVTVADCDFHDFAPAGVGGALDHPDGIQAWLNAGQAKRWGLDVVIEGNRMWRGAGAPVQGIFVRDYADRPNFEGLIVRRNLIVGMLHNGLTLAGMGAAHDNVVIAYPDQRSNIRLQNWLGALHDNEASLYIAAVDGKDRAVQPVGNRVNAVMTADEAFATLANWRGASVPPLQPLPAPSAEEKLRQAKGLVDQLQALLA